MQTIRQREILSRARIDHGYADRQRFLRRDRHWPEGLAFAIACAAVALFLVVGVPA